MIDRIIYGALALLILFLLFSTLILPYFRTTYEQGFGSEPYSAGRGGTALTNSYCSTPSATIVACSGCNSTTGYETFLKTCGSLIATTNGTHCLQCSDFGFKNTSMGLMLLILVIGLISFAIYFMPKIRK